MKVRNRKTGETREFKMPALWDLDGEEDCDGEFPDVDQCTGPCECRVEPDGECPQGWPSRLLAAGMI